MRKCKSGNSFCADAKKKGNESVGSFYLNFSFFFLKSQQQILYEDCFTEKDYIFVEYYNFFTINVGLGYPLVESISCLKIEW